MIHVQTYAQENGNDDDDDDDYDDQRLNDEQVEMTKKSLRLLDENNGYQPARATTPVYGDDDAEKRVANIQI